ncbi:hypothetical protein OG782_15445 [Streptomyces sp. NBC_00876]|uniref:hypothetical protein n=1 Tax=Streptomyces sp. NBC_00876 TaxID=2975853 RepID=UPI00386E9D59|nr:hypothetical protein OG782_15445 [Streptomyces sp. NBC_00876]
MKLGRILGVSAGAAALALTFSTQAMAADYSVQTDDGSPGGKISITLRGDVVTLSDQEADGWGVKGWIINSKGKTVYTLQAGGNGAKAIGRASQGGARNLAEKGAKYKLRVCLHKENRDAYCDDTSYFKNDH